MRLKFDNLNNTYIEQACEYEHRLAELRIKNGDNVDQVLTDFSRRLVEKFLHPYYDEIRNFYKLDYDSEYSIELYKKEYLDRVTIHNDK